LIKKAQKGDDKAFLQLFQTFEGDIYRTAFVYVKNKDDALDVVQECAYRSFKSIDKLKHPSYFKTWLFKIAINCSLDIIKKNKNTHPVEHIENFFSEVQEENVEEMEVSLQSLCDDLEPDEKSVVLLRFYHDLTINETAKSLDLPLGSAKTILYRALKKLRKKLKGDDKRE